MLQTEKDLRTTLSILPEALWWKEQQLQNGLLADPREEHPVGLCKSVLCSYINHYLWG